MKTIDKKLSGVYEFICSREGMNQETLKKEDKSFIFPENIEEMVNIKETINYLKNYAKIQATAKLLSSQKSIKLDIENAIGEFGKLVEKKKEEIVQINQLPKPTKKKNSALMYNFVNEYKESESKRVFDEREARKAKINSLREDIKIYQEKIKKLKSMEKTLNNPKKIIQEFFPEKDIDINSEQTKLINLCAQTITDGFSGSDLIGDDKVFSYDGKNYKVNYKNARSFISTIKAKKEILSAAEYIEAKNEYQDKLYNYKNELRKKQDYEYAYKMSNSSTFRNIAYKMNEITKLYNLLEKQEAKDRRNVLAIAKNSIRLFLGKEEKYKFSKKTVEQRSKLADRIQELTNIINQNEENVKSFNAYQMIRGSIAQTGFMDFSTLKLLPTEIRNYGTQRVEFLNREVSIEELQIHAKSMEDYSARYAEKLNQEKKEAKQKMDEKSNLSEKTKKILEKYGEKSIASYAKRYYGYGETEKKDSFSKSNMSASAAIMILEGIMGKRKISWDEIFESYANAIGRNKIKDETIDIRKTVVGKIELLQNQIQNMLQEPKPKRLEDFER